MKNLRKILTITMLLSVSIITQAQKPMLDSICVQIDEETHINMAIYDYTNLTANVENDLKNLQSLLRNNSEIQDLTGYSINFQPDKMLSIKKTEPGTIIYLEDNKQTKFQYNNYCNIYSDNYYLQIKCDRLKKLMSDSLINIMRTVTDTTSSIQGRLSKTYNYTFQGNNFIHNKQLDFTSDKSDVMSLEGGVGLSLIKKQPTLDITAKLGLMFSKKGIWKNQFYTSYNQLSYFDINSKIHLNGFINLGYRFNISNLANKPDWLGFEMGYLVKQNGDLFGKNTFKIGINWDMGKYMTVSPQFIFSGDPNEFLSVNTDWIWSLTNNKIRN